MGKTKSYYHSNHTDVHSSGNGNWIAGATKNAHGQFAAKAKAAGMSTAAFAAKKDTASGALGKQARLAETLMNMRKK